MTRPSPADRSERKKAYALSDPWSVGVRPEREPAGAAADQATAPAKSSRAAAANEAPLTRDVVDRRLGTDRRRLDREASGYQGAERRQSVVDRRSGLERRRGAGIRREEDRRSAEEGEMTGEQVEFIRAIELYKKVNRKLFPTWTEVLEVMQQLGYRKVLPREVKLDNVPEPDLFDVFEPRASKDKAA